MQSKQDLDLQRNFIGFKSRVFGLHRDLDRHWPVVRLREGEARPEEYRAYIKLLFYTYDKLARLLSGAGTIMTHQLLAIGRKALAEDAAILAIKREGTSNRMDLKSSLVHDLDLENAGMPFDLGAAYVLSASCFGASMIYKMLGSSDFGLYMPTNYVQIMSMETSIVRYQLIKTRILRDLSSDQDWMEAQKGAETIFQVSINEATKISQTQNFSNANLGN